MQMLIDIPEELYKYVRGELAESECQYDYTLTSWNAIHNGTPLPKGHGRLIDADNISFSQFFDAGDYAQARRGIHDAPTIIEADRESEE